MAKAPFRRTQATLDVLGQLVDGEEHYALQIINATGRPSGTVVPLLQRLEHHGWVTSRWEADTPGQRGPRRRYYQLETQYVDIIREIIEETGEANGHTTAA